MTASSLPEFQERLVAHAESISAEELTPMLSIDAEMTLAAVAMDVAEAVKRLEPYGMGNALPIFLSKRCKILVFRHDGFDGKSFVYAARGWVRSSR
jgi:single-stranded DNA-specific DHH superfamily exonuclease